MAKIKLLEVMEDHRARGTLGALRHRLALAADMPNDTEIKFGYLPDHLADCYYVEEPEDLTALPVDTLLGRVQQGWSPSRGEARAEIKRRLEA